LSWHELIIPKFPCHCRVIVKSEFKSEASPQSSYDMYLYKSLPKSTISSKIICMEYLEISRIITLLASVFIVLGLYDQAVKVSRTKSARDFTWTILVAILFNELAWINYGISLKEWPIIIVGIANLPAIFVIISIYRKYGNK